MSGTVKFRTQRSGTRALDSKVWDSKVPQPRGPGVVVKKKDLQYYKIASKASMASIASIASIHS